MAERARSRAGAFPHVPEVGEMVDFILADAKQELCLARRRGRSSVTAGDLGLIAGGGELPRAVAEAVRAAGRAVFVVPLMGSAPRIGSRISRMSFFRRASRGASSRR